MGAKWTPQRHQDCWHLNATHGDPDSCHSTVFSCFLPAGRARTSSRGCGKDLRCSASVVDKPRVRMMRSSCSRIQERESRALSSCLFVKMFLATVHPYKQCDELFRMPYLVHPGILLHSAMLRNCNAPRANLAEAWIHRA